MRRYGAAAVVMAFDEQGQADTAKRKIDICTRAYQAADRSTASRRKTSSSIPTFSPSPPASKSTPTTRSAFFEATRLDHAQTLPHAHVSGGVSNVSFSFRGNEPVREAMHAVFLYHAIRAGMDMGIVNAGSLTLYDDVEPELRERVEDVLLNRRADATERLLEFAEQVKGGGKKKRYRRKDLAWREKPVRERLSARAGARHQRIHRRGHRRSAACKPSARCT